MKILQALNLSKTYRGAVDVPVLLNVNFSVNRGELVAVMGASGSEKWTLLHILGEWMRRMVVKYLFRVRHFRSFPKTQDGEVPLACSQIFCMRDGKYRKFINNEYCTRPCPTL